MTSLRDASPMSSQTNPQPTPRAVSFATSGRTLTGLRWGSEGGIPTFGLHGWLDNANTFNRLAPLLPGGAASPPSRKP